MEPNLRKKQAWKKDVEVKSQRRASTRAGGLGDQSLSQLLKRSGLCPWLVQPGGGISGGPTVSVPPWGSLPAGPWACPFSSLDLHPCIHTKHVVVTSTSWVVVRGTLDHKQKTEKCAWHIGSTQLPFVAENVVFLSLFLFCRMRTIIHQDSACQT